MNTSIRKCRVKDFSPVPVGKGLGVLLPSPFMGEGLGVRVFSPRPVGEGLGVRVFSPRPVGEGLGVREYPIFQVVMNDRK